MALRRSPRRRLLLASSPFFKANLNTTTFIKGEAKERGIDEALDLTLLPVTKRLKKKQSLANLGTIGGGGGGGSDVTTLPVRKASDTETPLSNGNDSISVSSSISISISSSGSVKTLDLGTYKRIGTQKKQKIKKRNTGGRRRGGRFGGVPESEVLQMRLPDHICDGLKVLVVGINPGVMSAFRGHHYAGPGNHFWPCMTACGLVPSHFSWPNDAECLAHGIGFTNMVERTTRSSSDLSIVEVRAGAAALRRKVAAARPLIVLFNGKGIFETYSGRRRCATGVQSPQNNGTCVPGAKYTYVMPSSSARSAALPRWTDKLPFFQEVKALVDQEQQQQTTVSVKTAVKREDDVGLA